MIHGTTPVARNAVRRLLIVGGSNNHLGGVEAFCDRSAEALTRTGGWQVERVFASTAYLSFRRLPALFAGIRQLIAHARNRPDLTWIQYVNLPDLGYLILARLLGMRVMVTPHLGANWRSQDSRQLRWLSARVLQLAHRLALISWTQEHEIDLPGDVPRSLIRNFLPADVLTGPLTDADQLPPVLQIIHSSRLSEGKGTFLLVEACARLRDAGLAFETRITGGADEATMTRLRQMIADNGLADRVAVLGRVPEAELLDHLRRADILFHLSRIDSYPLIVLEAMACSVVPVVMELAGARDMIETYRGHVVSTAHPVDEAVTWLLQCNLAALRSQRRRVAEQVRGDYAWRRCTTALIAALDACIAGDTQLITQPEPVIEASC